MGYLPVSLALLLVGATDYTARVEKSEPPKEITVEQRRLLDAEPLVVRAGNDAVMRVWFRAPLPLKASVPDSKPAPTYRQIDEGTLVGVLELPRVFTDYRKQRLPAGIYTLRFAVQPDTGEHTDTAPHREFCLLTRSSDDPTTATIEPKKLIELSSKVNDGRHPAVLLLWPNNELDAPVRVLEKGKGVLVATVTRAAVSGTLKARLGFALTIAGSWSQ